MDIRPNSSGTAPTGESSSSFHDISGDDTKYIQPSETPSNSSEAKALVDRSVNETVIIDGHMLIDLVETQKFSNNIHYEIMRDLELFDRDLTVLPENLKVVGNIFIGSCSNLTALSKNFIIKEDLEISVCPRLTTLPEGEGFCVKNGLYIRDCGLTALAKDLKVDENINLGGCTSLTALPN